MSRTALLGCLSSLAIAAGFPACTAANTGGSDAGGGGGDGGLESGSGSSSGGGSSSSGSSSGGATDAGADAPTGEGGGASCAPGKFSLGVPKTYPDGTTDYGTLAVGDMNGDGFADLVVSNSDGNVNVFLNKKDGTFGALVAYPWGGDFNAIGNAIVLGDIDGDGRLDVVCAGNGAELNTGMMLGNGDGTLGAPTAINASGGIANNGAPGMGLADLNGDGKLDLIATGSSGIGIWLNAGANTPFAAGNVSYDPHGDGFTAADFNGDGQMDFATYDTKVNIWVNAGSGTFGTPVSYPLLDTSFSASAGIVAGDFNGDGKADVAALSSAGAIDVLLNKGDGTFGAAKSYSLGSIDSAGSLLSADLNGDGKLDLIASDDVSGTATLSVLMNDGQGGFAAPIRVAYASGTPGTGGGGSMGAASFDGSGLLGVAAVHASTGSGPTVAVVAGSCH